MADTTTALPSYNEPVIDRQRRWSPIWYPWIQKLLQTIRTEAEARFAISETIDEINGKWSIDLTEDGIQRGAITIDGSTTISEIGMLADKVVIYKPDGTGGKAVFELGTVNSVAGYGVGALLILDGAIVARHIDVETLSAISANIGTVTAGLLQNASGTTFINLTTGGFQFTAAS